MSIQSHPWKQELARRADALRDFAEPHRLTGTSRVRLEETVVLGCYTIRRLINGFLLPESCANQPFPMTVFPRRRQTAPQLGDAPLHLRYDLDACRTTTHDLLFLCHQVLQNCVFEPWLTTEHRLSGIYVTSDHQRKVALYGVHLADLGDLFVRLSQNE